MVALAVASAFLLSRPATSVAVPGMRLAGVADFTLSGTVSGLVPGVPSTLTVTVGNSYNVPITVKSLTVSVPSDPAACSANSYLSFDGTAFSGAPPSVTVSGLSQVIPANTSAGVSFPITLAAGAPNATCQNVTYNFDYTGTADYTANSVSVIMSSTNPSTSGQSVTLSATVTGDPNTATPAGSVVFFECTVPAALAAGSPASACTTSVALSGTVVLNGAGVATFSTSSLPTGSHSIFATFTPTAGSTDFHGSSSVVFVQQVTSGGGGGGGGGGTTTTSTTSTTVPSAPTVVLAKANNAAGTGYGVSEVAANGATSVPYRVTVTNPNSSPGIVSTLTDTVGSTTSPICPALIGTLVAPGASTTCDFTGVVPAAALTDTAVVGLTVNGVAPTATASSTVFPPVKGVVVTTTTIPGAPPTTVSPTGPTSGRGGGASTITPSGPLAFTGAHIAGMVLGGLAALLAGFVLSGLSRVRRGGEEVAQ